MGLQSFYPFWCWWFGAQHGGVHWKDWSLSWPTRYPGIRQHCPQTTLPNSTPCLAQSYFDNWFTSPKLLTTLWKQGIACLGTNCEDQPCSRLYYAQRCKHEKARKRHNRDQNSYSWWCWTQSYKVVRQQRRCSAEFICYCGSCANDTALGQEEEGICSDQVSISCVTLQPVYEWSWSVGFFAGIVQNICPI